jgi:alkylation response protein AidB-like acyl-CoA dehydrogenase
MSVYNDVMTAARVTCPDDLSLKALCLELAELASELDKTGEWPTEQLNLCARSGVFEWFLDPIWGGQGWSELDTVRGYLALSGACLTTTFIITQRTGACRRIAGSENDQLRHLLLPPLAAGELFATVGISHLTTSRRHLRRPVLTAERVKGGFRLSGFSPWVTGALAAQYAVLGADVVVDGEPTSEQILIAVPTDSQGVSVPPPAELVGVSASKTGPVQLDRVELSDQWLIAGPVQNVMASGIGATTGGHETSTLAIGLAAAAISFLHDEAARRDDLTPAYEALASEHQQLEYDLVAIAEGHPACSKEVLRQRANSLALRSSQAALSAAKGTGYVIGHPAGRWCREALFFLVWSCPQPVAAANLCELAGIAI